MSPPSKQILLWVCTLALLPRLLNANSCEPEYNCTVPGNSCYNFGTCSSAGTCACNLNYGFSGGNCTLEFCGGLVDGYNNRTYRPYHSLCCGSGYTGYSCNICTTNSSCIPPRSSLNSSAVVDARCNSQAVAMTNQHWSQCILSHSLWNFYFPFPTVISILKNVTSSSMFTAVYYLGDLQFSCLMSGCQQYYINSRSNVSYECASTTCQCRKNSSVCTIPTFNNLLATASGQSSLVCAADVSNSTCNLQLNFLNGFINGGFSLNNCNMGECIVNTSYTSTNSPISEKATVRTELNSGEVAGITIVSSLVAVALATFVLAYYQMKSYKNFKAPRAQVGALSFNVKTYSIPEGHHTLKYFSKTPKKLLRLVLRNISGRVEPGELLTILGPSGAGKTTLLHLLGHKLSDADGVLDGEISLGNAKISPADFARVCGFVRQEDILLPYLTVRETVDFAAEMALPECTSIEERQQLVDEVISRLKLVTVQHSRVGNEHVRGISGGERRRVSIAVELVKNPAVLLLDEPTSGLDANSALTIMQILADLARNSKTIVVCSLHQPRSDICGLFDKLLVLQLQDCLFYGKSSSVSSFLESRGLTCPENYNMADYLIDLASADLGRQATPTKITAARALGNTEKNSVVNVTSCGLPKGVSDSSLAEVTKTNQCAEEIRPPRPNETESELLEYKSIARNNSPAASQFNEGNTGSEAAGKPNPTDHGSWSYNTSYLRQFVLLTAREWKSNWRDIRRVASHMILGISLGLLIGGIYFRVPANLAGAQNRVGAMFYVLCILGFSSMSALASFSESRAVYKRERSDQFYGFIPLYMAKLIVDIIPLRIIPSTLLGTIFYFMMGLYSSPVQFFKFLAVVVLFNVLMGLLFLTLAVHVVDLGLANLVGSMTALFMMLFAGLLINQNQISSATFWLQYLSFFKYAYEAISVNELLTMDVYDTYNGQPIYLSGPVLAKSFFGFDVNSYVRNVIILSSLTAGFLVILCLSIRYKF